MELYGRKGLHISLESVNARKKMSLQWCYMNNEWILGIS